MRIAVLNANIAIGEMLQHALELAGHTVVIYDSLSKFLLAKIIEPTTASIPFDLLIVDLLKEGMSGAEVIHRVKNSFPDLPIILISAGSSRSTLWKQQYAYKCLFQHV